MTETNTLRDLIFGFRISQAIHVAAVLRVSDHLADGPRTIAQLAPLTATHDDSLRRLMRALAALGVYHEEPADTFALTDLGDGLRSEHPSHLRDVAVNTAMPYFWGAWGHLLHSIQTGENAFAALNGMGVWQYRAVEPDVGLLFDKAMVALTGLNAAAVAESYDFAGARTVVDVGGGQGGLIALVLNAFPGVRGVLFDLPHVIDGAPAYLAAEGVADRCEVVGGSFFETVPPGHDVYLLKSVIHDWPDAESVSILQRVRAAMTSDSVLLLVEQLVAGPNEGVRTKFSDLNMLALPGGRERSVAEYDALLSAADLRLVRTIETRTDFYVIEALPAL